jgi:hypothetical protein
VGLLAHTGDDCLDEAACDVEEQGVMTIERKKQAAVLRRKLFSSSAPTPPTRSRPAARSGSAAGKGVRNAAADSSRVKTAIAEARCAGGPTGVSSITPGRAAHRLREPGFAP